MYGNMHCWRVITASVRGAIHCRRRLPNQDAIRCFPKEKSGSWICLALADGHGSARSFRSQIGARYAVKTAIDHVKQILDGKLFWEGRDPITSMQICQNELAKDIHSTWQQNISAHIKKYPFSPEEFHEAAQEKITNLDIDENRHLVYGCTLIVVFVSQKKQFFMQIGDGDILMVSRDGRVSCPVPGDSRLFANETTSLAIKDAWKDFRFYMNIYSDDSPSMILAATDGYKNSFRDEAAFNRVGSDLLLILQQHGAEYVNKYLRSWLLEATRKGSGDDISAGIIYRSAAGDE